MLDLISQKCKTCPKPTSPQQLVHKPLWARSLGAAGTQPDRILFGIMMIMMMLTIVMIKMSIFGEISWWWEFPTALFYTFSKCRWNYIVTHRINKLIHLWLWHFDLHLPLDRVCLKRVNSTIGNGGLSRFRSRQSSTPGACCSKFPAWSLHTFAALTQKRRSVKLIFVLVNIQHIHLKTRKLAGAPKEFFLNGTEEDIGEARGTNVELISESAEQKQHDTMWQSAEVSNFVSGPNIPNN